MLWTEAPLSVGDTMSPGPGHLILAAPGLGWAGLGSCGRGWSLHTATGTHHTFTQYYTVFYTVSITVLQCRTDTYYKVLVSRLPATSATIHAQLHHVCLYRELLHLCKTPRILGTVKLRTEAPPTVTPSSHQYWQKLCSSYLQMF